MPAGKWQPERESEIPHPLDRCACGSLQNNDRPRLRKVERFAKQGVKPMLAPVRILKMSRRCRRWGILHLGQIHVFNGRSPCSPSTGTCSRTARRLAPDILACASSRKDWEIGEASDAASPTPPREGGVVGCPSARCCCGLWRRMRSAEQRVTAHDEARMAPATGRGGEGLLDQSKHKR